MTTQGSILVCGSVALDIIGYFPGSFAEYEKRHGIRALNASLQLSSVVRSFGGCGINICYGLRLLGHDGIPLGVAGKNFDAGYRAHLEQLGIETANIVIDPEFDESATAIVLIDADGNHLTAFYSGPARSKHHLQTSEIRGIDKVELAIVTPDDAPVMLHHARGIRALGIPLIFDPGPGLAEFDRDSTEELLALSTHVVLNVREWEILQDLTGRTATAICNGLESVIVTRGRAGAIVLLRDGTSAEIPAVPATRDVDATGCGDAFRAGYLTGLIRDEPVEICGRLGALTATYNLESPQTQNYRFTSEEFADRFRSVFGMPLPWQLGSGYPVPRGTG